MPVFKDSRKLAAHIKKALDYQTALTLKDVQAELGSKAVSPKDTGRFLSNWFAAEGTPSRETTEAVDSPNTDADQLRVDSSKTYFISNSLPYAQYVAIEGRVVSKPTGWFKAFRDQQIPKIMSDAAKQAKKEFEL